MKAVFNLFRICLLITIVGLSLAACKEESAPSLSGKVTIDGLSYAGQTLTANTDGLKGSGAVSYQWRLDGKNIGGANDKTYIVQFADVGANITVKVTRAGFSGGVVSDPAYAELPILSGTVTIDGIPGTGQILTANTEALGGSGKISYQWRLDGNNIGGATNNSFTVRTADAGSIFTLRVTRSGNTGEVISSPTGIIFRTVPSLSGTVKIEGLPHLWQTLTANTDTLGGAGMITYQWMRNGNNIDNTNNKTYTIQQADMNSILTVSVTRPGYLGEVVSEPTDVISYGGPPPLTGAVKIEGIAAVGYTLTANTEELEGSGDISYQWKRSGDNIDNADSRTYLIQHDDMGLFLSVSVTRADNSGEIISGSTTIIIQPVMEITGIPSSIAARVSLTLTGTITPGNSTYRVINWSLHDAGTTGAVISGGVLNTMTEGTVIVRAAVINGTAQGIDFIQDFSITVHITPVTAITGVPTTAIAGRQLTLTGTVSPSDATFKTIIWSVTTPGTTGASINGSVMDTTDAGTAGIRATITNGTAQGTDYTQDFSITVEEPIYFDQWVTKVEFGSSQTVTINFINMEGHDLYLAKVNTGSSNVTASNTGLVANEAPSSSIAQSLAPNFSDIINSRQRPIMGHPNPDKLKLPPPVPYEPSSKSLLKVAAAVVGNTRSFWIDSTPLASSSNFTQYQATLLAAGEHGNIWVVNNSISTTQAQTMAEKFDVIYPATTNIYGYEYGGRPGHPVPGGVDGDQKVQILVYPMTGTSILGYFWSKDYYNTSYSNKTEMFYINSIYANSNPLMIYDTLTHEFQHMIHFNVKNVEKGLNPSTWYNEMMSIMSQDIISSLIPLPMTSADHVSWDMRYFNQYYATEGLTDWDSSYPYASKFAFGAYFTRNYGGAEFVRRLSATNSVDVASITTALNEMAPGVTFNEALLRFAEALVYSGSKMPPDVNTFDKTVSQTINGITYNAYAMNIWDMSRWTVTTKGPVTYGLTEQLALRPYSVSLHTGSAWQNKSGSFSVTLQKPSSSNITFVLVAKKR